MPDTPANEDAPVAADAHGGMDSKYFRAADLRRLRNLFFSSRKVVEGHYAGRHGSPMRGHSVEFNDFRQYMPGDEIGDIDWKVYGRTDKLFIKLFEHQSDMTVSLLVDASASMAYAGADGKSKYDQACRMAAAIAFLTTKQQDKVAFGLAREGLQEFRRPYGSFGHFVGILRAMEHTQPGGEAALAEALRAMASMVARRGLLVVFSDLLDEPEAIFNALSIFTHHGCEVILFHVLAADELHLPDEHGAIFVDSETGKRLAVNVADVRGQYDKRIQRFLATWSSSCKGRGIDYRLVSTAMHYRKALEEYLFQRASMA